MDDRRRDLFLKRMAQALSDLHAQLPGVIAEMTYDDFDDDELDALAEVLRTLAKRAESHGDGVTDIGADGAR